MPGLKATPLEAFDRKNIVERGGDLSICLDQQDDFLETKEVYALPPPASVAIN